MVKGMIQRFTLVYEIKLLKLVGVEKSQKLINREGGPGLISEGIENEKIKMKLISEISA